MADFKDTVKTIMQTKALFTLSTFTFVKYDILTEHLQCNTILVSYDYK